MNDGGPAFPYSALTPEGPQIYGDSKGMSLRDWFAGQALATIVTFTVNPAKLWSEAHDRACADIAYTAYKMADAMLAESKRRQDG